MQEERKKWNKNTFGVTAENLVFLDESGASEKKSVKSQQTVIK